MPLRKNKNRKCLAKQNNKMAAKLMSISLKTDDYIYNNKPITVSDAKKYLEEMMSLKNKSQNERYLQVIEKLTNYMKIIIKEQLPKENFKEDLNSTFKNIPIADKYNGNDTLERKARDGIEKKLRSSPIIDISKEETQQEVLNKQSSILPPKQIINNIKCSNDIKNNITRDNNDENHRIPESKRFTTKDICDANRNNCTQDINNNCGNLENRVKKCHALQKTQQNKYLAKNLPSISTESNIDELNQQSTIKASKSHVNTIDTNLVRKNNKREIKGKEVQTRVTGKKVPVTKNTNKAHNKNKSDVLKVKQVSVPTKNYSNNEKHINASAHLNNIINNSGSKSKTNVSNSRKKKLEIDLSWVEGIKFVREIDTWELTNLNNINDSFWNDLSFPPNMNSIDFDYDN